MAQVKIYASATLLVGKRQQFSDAIHRCLTQQLGLPENKRFHRFFPLQTEDFVFPEDRTANYTILEISLFEGRSLETKKALIRQLIRVFESDLGIHPQDLEITLFETPKANWGIRGMPADELTLNYKVEK